MKQPNPSAGGRDGGRAAPVETLEARLLFASTNDSYFASQYALASSAVPTAWDTTRGRASVIVANIDSGIDYAHPDLYANIWINQSEIPSSVRSKLKDTDADGRISFYDLNHSSNRPRMNDSNRNGYIDARDLLRPRSQGGWEDGVNGVNNRFDTYVDDIVGWDFAENDNEPFDDAGGNDGHGTHVAGIIGAMGNNGRGISGVMQKVSMMAVRIFYDSGDSVSDSKIAQAIRYAANSGAKVANASWGGQDGYNGDVLYAAIQYAGSKGQLFVTAAGNAGKNLDRSWYDEFPAEYNLDNIVAVAATTSSKSLASWSNYGLSKVDLAAPGDNILSTLPGNRYGRTSGTSTAAPMVAGAAALMLASNKSLAPWQLKQRLLNAADESTTLYNRSVCDGRLNVRNAVRNVSGYNLSASAIASLTGGGGGGGGTSTGTFSTSRITDEVLANL